MRLKDLFHRKSKFQKELERTKYLLKQLFSIKLVNVVLIILFLFAVSPFVLFLILKPVPVKNINYGITFSKKYAQDIGLDWKTTYLKILDDLGPKNLRLIAYWDETEPYQNYINDADIKWQLDEAEKRNLNVIITIGRKVPRYPECFAPTWVTNMKKQSDKEDALYKYISKITLSLKGYKSIKMWQVENEPFFDFGECTATRNEVIAKEISLVRSIDKRPIIVQDSGEGGFWVRTYQLGDYLGISMYRKVWFDFWKALFNKNLYFQYPLSTWSYKIKANLMGVPMDKIMVTELQAEPWGPVINSQLSTEEKDKTMSKNDFLDTISYAQKTGFSSFYFWGAEWWLWEKEIRNEPFYWDTAKALFK